MIRHALVILGSVILAHTAPSGMEYDAWCCSGTDCAPISSKAVTPQGTGYRVELNAGDHPMVTKHHVYTIPYQAVKRSTDGGYHICFFPDEDTVRCFYAPDQGA
jgi:hypothetical protein